MSASMSPDGYDEEMSEYEEPLPAANSGTKRTRRSNNNSNAVDSNSEAAGPPAKVPATRAAKGRTTAKRGKAGAKEVDPPAASPLDDHDANDPASARKLQNRTAQREFRQRKLQYVKELEARVEFLSNPKDEQLEVLKALLHGFFEENKQLRNLLKGVTAFIGSGLGGRLSELGFKQEDDFDDFVRRTDKDTLHRLYEEYQAKNKLEKDMHNKDSPGYAPTASTSTSTGSLPNQPRRSTGGISPVTTANNHSGPVGTRGNVKATEETAVTDGQASGEPGTAHPASSSSSREVNYPNEHGPMQPARYAAAQASQQPPHLHQNDSNRSYQQNRPASVAASSNAYTNQPFHSNMYAGLGLPTSTGGTLQQPQQTVAVSNSPSNFPFAYSSQDGDRSQTVGSFGMPQQAQMQHFYHTGQPSNSGPSLLSRPSMSTPAYSNFFFDSAPQSGSTPLSSFASDFLTEYLSTGLTPLIDTSSGGNGLSNFESIHNWEDRQFNQNGNGNPATSSQDCPTFATVEQIDGIVDQYSERLRSAVLAQARAGASKLKVPLGKKSEDIIEASPLLALVHTITSHLRKKVQDPNYILPLPLRPTPLQLSTPHDFRIDGLLFSETRDLLILQTEYNLDTLLSDMIENITVHPGAQGPIDNSFHEYSETFLRRYRNIVGSDMLRATNRWRRERGEQEIVL